MPFAAYAPILLFTLIAAVLIASSFVGEYRVHRIDGKIGFHRKVDAKRVAELEREAGITQVKPPAPKPKPMPAVEKYLSVAQTSEERERMASHLVSKAISEAYGYQRGSTMAAPSNGQVVHIPPNASLADVDVIFKNLYLGPPPHLIAETKDASPYELKRMEQLMRAYYDADIKTKQRGVILPGPNWNVSVIHEPREDEYEWR